MKNEKENERTKEREKDKDKENTNWCSIFPYSFQICSYISDVSARFSDSEYSE